MKSTVTVVVVTFILGWMVVAPARAEDAAQMIAAASALDQRFLTAINAGDVDGVMATYWNNPELVTFWPDAMITRGWAATKEGVTQMFKDMPGATLELTESHQMIAGDAVIGWGLWRMSLPLAEGGSTTMEGRYTDVKAKRDGRWVYLLDHASAPIPPAAESPDGKRPK